MIAGASHPTMGAWIEIVLRRLIRLPPYVAPHDGCVDWNIDVSIKHIIHIASHPTMGAWIEIYPLQKVKDRSPTVAPHDGCVDWNLCLSPDASSISLSHPTMGAWIEIFCLIPWSFKHFRRTPRWVRGLKYSSSFFSMSLRAYCRTPRWVRGLKYTCPESYWWYEQSHPTMGAWIEIFLFCFTICHIIVAPHDGCVDWNLASCALLTD